MFNTSRNKCSSLVLKPCKFDQKTSEEVLFIKAQQMSRQNHSYRGLMLKLDTSSTQAVSIENYEIRNSRFDYMHILEYLCRVSFLITLDIYKDYFKGHQKVMQGEYTCIVWSEKKIALVHLSFCRSYCVFTPRVLWPRSFLIFIVGWTKKLYSQHLP